MCALSSLGAVGCRCCVRVGAWVLVPLQGAAAGCRCCVRLGAWVLVALLCAAAVCRCCVPLCMGVD